MRNVLETTWNDNNCCVIIAIGPNVVNLTWEPKIVTFTTFQCLPSPTISNRSKE